MSIEIYLSIFLLLLGQRVYLGEFFSSSVYVFWIYIYLLLRLWNSREKDNFNTIDYFLQENIIKIHIEKYLNLYNFLIWITNYIYISKYLEVYDWMFFFTIEKFKFARLILNYVKQDTDIECDELFHLVQNQISYNIYLASSNIFAYQLLYLFYKRIYTL